LSTFRGREGAKKGEKTGPIVCTSNHRPEGKVRKCEGKEPMGKGGERQCKPIPLITPVDFRRENAQRRLSLKAKKRGKKEEQEGGTGVQNEKLTRKITHPLIKGGGTYQNW